jgi:hypothetical protein
MYGIVLDQMSHGADTWDYEQLFGNIPDPCRDIPVVFFWNLRVDITVMANHENTEALPNSLLLNVITGHHKAKIGRPIHMHWLINTVLILPI